MLNSVSIRDPKLLDAMSYALIDDPLYTSLTNDLQQRRKLIKIFSQGQLDKLHGRYVGHQIGDDFSAVTLWLDPTKCAKSSIIAGFRNQISMLFSGSIKQIGAISGSLNNMERAHQQFQAQCQWYLSLVYVDASKRGLGLASQLIKPQLDQLDGQRAVCGVDTFNPRNVTIYRNYGFELCNQVDFGAGLANYMMRREPR